MEHQQSRRVGVSAVGAHVPRRERLIAQLDGAARVVVLRAPQGFGKTVLLRQWQETASAGARILRCDNGWREGAIGFWARLARLVPPVAGHEPVTFDDEDAAFEGVAEALKTTASSIALVLDDFQVVRDPTVSERLLALVAACPSLRLVVATRARHPIESAADALVLTLDDLALDPADVIALAGRHGAGLRVVDAELIVDAMGGWPAMIDRIVRHLAKRPITSERVSEAVQLTDDDLTSWLLDEVVSPEHVEVMAQLAVAEHLTVGAARFLTGNDSAEDVLDDLLAQGLLTRTMDLDSNEPLFEFPTVIRRLALARMGRASADDGDARSSDLARWFAEQGRPEVALVQAFSGRDWTLIAQLFESSWLDLINADEDLIVNALRQMPEEIARTHPKVHAVRYIVLGTVMSPQDLPQPMARTFVDAVDLARRMGAVNAVEIAVAEFIVLRRSGRYRDAARIGRMAHFLAEIIGSHVPDYLIPMIPMARLQLALTFELAGRAKDAAEQLALSLVALESVSNVDGFELNQITGVLAAKAAAEGDLVASRVWTQRQVPTEGSVPRVWLMPYVPSGHRIARAIDAVDALERADADEQLVQLRLQEARDELWAMSAWAQARYDLAWSDQVGAARNLEFAKLRHREWLNSESAAEPALLSAEVDFSLAAGLGNRASVLLMKTESKHPAIQLARARLEFLTGESERAAALTRDVLRSRHITDRVRLDALVLRASAVAREEGTDSSMALWREACTVASRMGSPLLPFAMADAAQRDSAAARLDALAEIVRRCRERGVDALFPERVAVINLTAREHEVLEKLALDIPIMVIARIHYVSEATIRTQIRSLYGKLAVHSRDEAVVVAEAEGLL